MEEWRSRNGYLNYAWYNLGTIVKTLRVTPAMQLGIIDHVWTIEEFQAALMKAEPCDAPIKQALAMRTPEVTHRELPGGRGFLRVVDGGKVKSMAPTPIAPTPLPVKAVASTSVSELPRWTQLDLFVWKQSEKQLNLFTDG